MCANEFRHADVGTELTKAEWEHIDTHIANNQAQGDILYFNGTRWVRLAKGVAGQFLRDTATWLEWVSNLVPDSDNARTLGLLAMIWSALYVETIRNPNQAAGNIMEILKVRELRHPDPAAAEPIRIFDLLEALKLHNLRLVAGTEEFGAGIRTIVITRQWGDPLFDAGALTDSDTIWTQPAGSTLLGIKMELVEQFVAPGPLTDMDITVGDAGDNTGLLNPAAHNLVTDAVGSQYKTRGPYWDTPAEGAFWYAHAAHAWLAYSTAVGANMNALTAGQIKFIITYLEI